MSKVEVMYNCKRCSAVKRVVMVEARVPDQDIVAWVQGVVMTAVGNDHLLRHCSSDRVDLMLPIPADDRPVGSAPLH